MIKKKLFLIYIAFSVVLLTCWIAQISAVADQNKRDKPPDVHFYPTPHEVVEIMLRLADVNKNDVLYDLGCGDGRIVIAAAKKVGARAFGFDIDPKMVKISRENVSKEGVEHLVTIQEQDIFELDLSGASVITLYLLPELNIRLIPEIKRLQAGIRIVSHGFDMKGVIPDVEATVYRPGGGTSKVYLWTTPLRDTYLPMIIP